MGSNTQTPANEVGVNTIVRSYSVNNSSMCAEHVDTRAIQA